LIKSSLAAVSLFLAIVALNEGIANDRAIESTAIVIINSTMVNPRFFITPLIKFFDVYKIDKPTAKHSCIKINGWFAG
jgi:hypothetical protein